MSEIGPGTTLRSKLQRAITVKDLLGEGGQGRVYRVASDGEEDLALKWYHPPTPLTERSYKEQRLALNELVSTEPPDTRFLWPLDLVDHGGRYGYLMKLRPKEYASIEQLILGRLKFPATGPFRVLCTAAIGIADCFRKLHLSGLCYKDINYGGPFFRPDNGEVLICDNDNVRANKTKGIIFFAEFAAPEVNRAEADCTTKTDEHSLAVLLFYMFVRGNPLEGKREASTVIFEDNAKLRTFGKDPIFVFHPTNLTNRPMRGLHDAVLNNWARLPRFLHDAFTTVFTDGLTSPVKRLNDTQWVDVMSRLRDTLTLCYACGRETFVDFSTLGDAKSVTCTLCKKPTPRPLRLRFKDTEVALSDGCEIYPHHLDIEHDFGEPIAILARHPQNPELAGLKNLTKSSWTFRDPDGSSKDVAPGKSVALQADRTIHFGSAQGTILF